MVAKRREYPRRKAGDPAYFEDDWDNLENEFDHETYEEAVEVLREGKRVGGRRV